MKLSWLKPDPLHKLEKQRQSLLQQDLPVFMNKLCQLPLPDLKKSLHELDILALDIETTGLHPTTDTILSLGAVTIRQATVCLNTAHHTYIKQAEYLRPRQLEKATIHHIMPEHLNQGILLYEAMSQFLDMAQGKILLAHCASIEQQFIQHALNKCNLPNVPLIWLDTMSIEKSLSHNRMKQHADYSLSFLRQQHNLPSYTAHNALSDAIATAELFLAQVKIICTDNISCLKTIYQRSKRYT